jgi:hypothetical protein
MFVSSVRPQGTLQNSVLHISLFLIFEVPAKANEFSGCCGKSSGGPKAIRVRWLVVWEALWNSVTLSGLVVQPRVRCGVNSLVWHDQQLPSSTAWVKTLTLAGYLPSNSRQGYPLTTSSGPMIRSTWRERPYLACELTKGSFHDPKSILLRKSEMSLFIRQ